LNPQPLGHEPSALTARPGVGNFFDPRATSYIFVIEGWQNYYDTEPTYKTIFHTKNLKKRANFRWISSPHRKFVLFFQITIFTIFTSILSQL
jgi:hypothetical protein